MYIVVATSAEILKYTILTYIKISTSPSAPTPAQPLADAGSKRQAGHGHDENAFLAPHNSQCPLRLLALASLLSDMGDFVTTTGKPAWHKVVEQKRAEREALIQPYLTSIGQHETITAISDVAVLASMIASGELKTFDVTMAYVQR